MTYPSVTCVRRLPSIRLPLTLALAAALWLVDGVPGHSPLGRAAMAADGATTAVESVALIADGQISGCAVQARFVAGGDTANIRFALLKDETQPAGTRFELAAAMTGTDGAIRHIEALSLTTASASTAPTFSQPVAGSEGNFSVSGTFGDLQGGSVMRDVMVSGADIRISVRDRPPLVLKITGPLSASARAGYLQCAGDLFRPEAPPR